jgi:hypothetical protein
MPNYLACMRAENGWVAGAIVIDCANDQEARARGIGSFREGQKSVAIASPSATQLFLKSSRRHFEF